MIRISGGMRKGYLLKSPKTLLRPTSGKVRQAVFNFLRPSIAGAAFLDLYAGSGAMGIEALSSGAARAVFIDRDPKAVQCIKDNLEKCGFRGQALVIRQDVLKGVGGLEGARFDIIYVDPPYGSILSFQPLIDEITRLGLLKQDGVLLIETPEALPGAHVRQFGQTYINQFDS